MDVDKATGMAAKVDNFFKAWSPVFKAHWGKMIIAFILLVFGWFCYLVYSDVEKNGLEEAPIEEQYDYVEPQYQQEEYHPTKKG
jgi:hypothetical protein